MKSLIAGLSFAILALSGAIIATAQEQLPPPTQASPCGPRETPSEQAIYDRTMRRFASLGLTPQQQGQIQAIVGQYSQAHPAGSPLDVSANRAMHETILGVLTPQQRDTLAQENEQRADEMSGHRRCMPKT